MLGGDLRFVIFDNPLDSDFAQSVTGARAELSGWDSGGKPPGPPSSLRRDPAIFMVRFAR